LKIVIDMQACQSEGSALRGIGRYSMELGKGIARNRGLHGVHFLLNAAFDTDTLEQELTRTNGATCESYQLLGLDGTHGDERRRLQRLNDEILNWRYACAGADALHVSSIFEGWQAGRAHVSSNTADVPGAVRSATLYDLIPLLFADIYLPDSERPLYDARVALFRQLDLVFAISESARQDAISRLAIAPHRIVTIGAAVSSAFHHLDSISPGAIQQTLARCRLGARFILYTGGIDYRKNIDGLLAAYAALPEALVRDVQLAIVCEIPDAQRRELLIRAQALGVANPPVFTGYLSDQDLNVLYNVCEIFVFPSLYEGFGLPLLEAMTCGACVISSNTSSMPEIVGDPEVLFDPHDTATMTRLMFELLANPYRRRRLSASNRHRARNFSWDAVAFRVIEAMEDAHARTRIDRASVCGASRPRAALVAPLLAQRAIGSYAAALLPYWQRHFELDIVAIGCPLGPGELPDRYRVMDATEFTQSAQQYSAILYHIGTAELPQGSYELLRLLPGIVVIHDSPAFRDADGVNSTGAGLTSAGDDAEVAPRVQERVRGDLQVDGIVYDGPMLRKVIQHARGVIFGSQRSADLMLGAYPDLADVPVAVTSTVVYDDTATSLTAPVAFAARPTFDVRMRWSAAQRRPARVAEFDAGVAVHLMAVDHARCAGALARRVAAMIALDGWDEQLSSSAGDAISAGIAIHPFSGRWFAAGS
jgi:glycosyltransferase involved in cell wall biosynthesis